MDIKNAAREFKFIIKFLIIPPARKPDSVPAVTGGNHLSLRPTRDTKAADLPGKSCVFYVVLHRKGLAMPVALPRTAVSSYLTFSPLP